MGREGRRTVEAKFTTQVMMSRLINVYDTLLNAKKINNDIVAKELF